MFRWPRTSTKRRRYWALITTAAALTATGCGGSSSSGNASGQIPASAKQTIVFATQGLGSEGDATNAAVKEFEAANRNITVTLLPLSPTGDVAYQQLQQRFISGSSTPDVITSDVIWPSAFARPGWLANLDSFHLNTANFFPGQIASGTYKGHLYAVPWFINAEGLYYRTDLVPTPPTTTAELVSDAQAAMKKDAALKEGLAFEGNKYEGSVTVFQSMGGQIATSNLSNVNSSANQAVLQFMSDSINKYKIAPTAAETWTEANVQSAWQSGQTPFAVNWPYLYQLSEASGSSVAGKTGWVPFPSTSGAPQASLGGDDLAINAKSTHQAAAWKFIQFLTSDTVQIERAISAGDPPAVQSAYNSALFAKAPYYQQEQAVFKYATARPVTPVYPQISVQLQGAISQVLSGQAKPSDALSGIAPTIQQLLQTAGS